MHVYILRALHSPLLLQAYQYTSITSVTLLDCFTIPAVMALSWLILRYVALDQGWSELNVLLPGFEMA
jgi:hypothetical protein